MIVLLIKKCSDSAMWYRNFVGRRVPYLRDISEGYLSLDEGGYTNIVLRDDAEKITLEETARANTH